jgi:translation initiation factor 1 (eIF-1/SUI1)
MTVPLTDFLEGKVTKKTKKKKYQQRREVKVKCSKEQKKQQQDIYEEQTDTSYGRGVSVVTDLSKKIKKRAAHNAQKKCKCGSTMHSRTTHYKCPFKRKMYQLWTKHLGYPRKGAVVR